MKKRAVLFCNGEIKNIAFHGGLLREDDYCIAVDGGGRYCQALNIMPDLVLGDFDSLPSDIQRRFRENNVESLVFPKDKDYIDLALGIEAAIHRGYEDILIFGALGGKRIDMEIGNLLLLTQYRENIVIADEFREITCVRQGKSITVQGKKGDYLSLIPLCPSVKTGKSEGLLYQLKDLEFSLGETRSISNEITENEAVLSLEEGTALLICQKK